jgi:hypothetical protein
LIHQIVDAVREALRCIKVKAKTFAVNTRDADQGMKFRLNVVEEIPAGTGFILFIKVEAVSKILFGIIFDDQLHASSFRRSSNA